MKIAAPLRFPAALALVPLLALATLQNASAGSATWDLTPTSSDWNTAANWLPTTVPNGPSDVATFGVSSTTAISFSQSVEVNAIDFIAGASAFTISLNPGQTLTISGAGVSNLSGTTQNFTTIDRKDLGAGMIVFTNSATAGIGVTYTNNGRVNGLFGVSSTLFFDNSNAGSSLIINNSPRSSLAKGGFTLFADESSAANSIIINAVPKSGNFLDSQGAATVFTDNSTAGNAVIVAKGSNGVGDNASEIDFEDQSTADHATITVEGGGSNLGALAGAIFFRDTATAGNASVTLLGGAAGGNSASFAQFLESSTAGNATFLVQGGQGESPTLEFFNTSSGGEAAITVNGNATVSIEFHESPGTTIGSLAGDGTVTVGSLALTIGTNDQSTNFAGTIEGSSNSAGSVIKTGTGTLILSGANTYGAGTTVEEGTLLAATTDASATGNGPVKADGGILGGDGVISGAVTVGSGAFLTPAAGTTQHKTLTLQSSLALKSDSTYTVSFDAKTNRAQTDKVFANGVTISNATIAIEGTAQGTLTNGTVITLISNTGANPISGTFSNLPEGAIVTVNGNNLQASYTGGDGNDLTLTVVP